MRFFNCLFSSVYLSPQKVQLIQSIGLKERMKIITKLIIGEIHVPLDTQKQTPEIVDFKRLFLMHYFSIGCSNLKF